MIASLGNNDYELGSVTLVMWSKWGPKKIMMLRTTGMNRHHLLRCCSSCPRRRSEWQVRHGIMPIQLALQICSQHRGIGVREVKYSLQATILAVAPVISKDSRVICKGLWTWVAVVHAMIASILLSILRFWLIRKGSGISLTLKHWYVAPHHPTLTFFFIAY